MQASGIHRFLETDPPSDPLKTPHPFFARFINKRKEFDKKGALGIVPKILHVSAPPDHYDMLELFGAATPCFG